MNILLKNCLGPAQFFFKLELFYVAVHFNLSLSLSLVFLSLSHIRTFSRSLRFSLSLSHTVSLSLFYTPHCVTIYFLIVSWCWIVKWLNDRLLLVVSVNNWPGSELSEGAPDVVGHWAEPAHGRQVEELDGQTLDLAEGGLAQHVAYAKKVGNGEGEVKLEKSFKFLIDLRMELF